jgi:tRNA threonylcarbamoyladenosine biosynthesis protein TsaE
MTETLAKLIFESPDETANFACKFGKILRPGDAVLLVGDIGAGKSFFARALIQSLQTTPEDVPSPTFTLVQTYDTDVGEIWHADLYRLSGPDEIVELGLTDAFETSICLIEWPDRLADLAPKSAITLALTTLTDETREVLICGASKQWGNRMEVMLNDQP